ncbi:hypothetical protein KFU94_49500 [Chloroflexi bacterium TSY]|nr:hypothetical protein [Chloroflexi bacterium TSY]
MSAPADEAVTFPPTGTTEPHERDRIGIDRSRVTLADLSLRPVAPSDPVASGEAPVGMCHVLGGPFRFVVRHNTSTVMEGACYGGVDHLLDKNHPPQFIELADFGWIKLR